MKSDKLLTIFDIMLPEKLQKKLSNRLQENTLRQLGTQQKLIDFSSNDYLGFSVSRDIYNLTHHYLELNSLSNNGSTGSRLLSGNHGLYSDVETMLSEFHNSESALIFNSGYTANLGLFSCVPQRGDLIFYDEFIHASIRDGIHMSNAKAYKFKHNDLKDLEEKLSKLSKNNSQEVYIVTESVFSMDGDSPNLVLITQISDNYNCNLIIDEAHAVGVFGKNGVGLIQELQLEHKIFARVTTFGKALGSHGAVILGSKDLIDYLINFSRPFIYTTALPPHALMTIKSAYKELLLTHSISKLHKNITFFKSEIKIKKLQHYFIESHSAIQCCIISGNENVKSISNQLHKKGFDVKPILSPTVPKGKERLRFCLHSYNSSQEITKVLDLLATFVK